ncbi:hypothetical protein BLX87_07295 [Bacillus sp. VT-16-64]|nr:hypothetical protein BLX87_07295 [Bacillus sp. VT-16-64]
MICLVRRLDKGKTSGAKHSLKTAAKNSPKGCFAKSEFNIPTIFHNTCMVVSNNLNLCPFYYRSRLWNNHL